MTFNALSFLAEPGFVLFWYLFGALAAAWVIWDLCRVNTPLDITIPWAWPIVVIFFSVLGLALYLAAARASGVARAHGAQERPRPHDAREPSMLRRINGAVIRCIAGSGLGIMTAMVIAHVLELSFWQEFWFEYAVGLTFSWLVFKLSSVKPMTSSTARALARALRTESFSMLTMMGGMGAVMTWVTPAVVGLQPKPTTTAWLMAKAGRALQNDRAGEAARVLGQATRGSTAAYRQDVETAQRAAATEPYAYRGVALLNALGAVIGEIRAVEPQRVRGALGGAHDVWGWWDWRPRQEAWIAVSELLLGPRRRAGNSFVMLPTADTPPLALASAVPGMASSAR